MTVSQIICELLFGWLIADLVSGALHWWEDRLGIETTPIIGKLVILPNRDHHRDPIAFTRANVWVRSSTTWLVTALIGAAWLALLGPSVVFAGAMLGGFMVNEIHAWAHRPGDAPRFIRLVQETGLIQSPRHHGRHHRGAHERHYCIITNWLNPFLDAIGFWSRMESGLERIGVSIYREPKR